MKNLAFFISRLLGPFPLLCLLWLVTAVKSGIGFWRAIWVYPLILTISLLIPTLVTTYLIATKRVKDIEWSNIKERQIFLPPISLLAIFSLLTLSYFLTNATIFHLSLLFSAIFMTMVFIWAFFDFKVSGHVTVATITFSGVNLFLHFQFWWLFFLIPIIIWARYQLKLHTLAQLVSGFILPIAFSLLAIFFFGYPAVP